MRTNLADFLNLLSKIDVGKYRSDLTIQDNFASNLDEILDALNIKSVAGIFQLIDHRTYSFSECLELDNNTISYGSLLANKLKSEQFRILLPNLLKYHYGTRINYLLHIPKTGGQSFVNNIIDSNMVVWDVNPESHLDFVYYELPLLLSKLSRSNTITVHSHMFYTHLQKNLNFDSVDSVFCAIRKPKSIHLSNINYIYENLLHNHKNKNIDSRWSSFSKLVSPDNKLDSLANIANSPEYCLIYSDIISKYIFGEVHINVIDLPSLLNIASSYIDFFDISRINDVLLKNYGISQPLIYNARAGDSYDQEILNKSINWENIIINDDNIYDYLMKV